MVKVRGMPGDDGNYCAKVKAAYGVAGSSSYPAPGSNGPAQMLYDKHQAYLNANNSSVVEGSDSWPGSQNPTTMRTRQ